MLGIKKSKQVCLAPIPFTHAQQAGVIALKARLPFRMARNPNFHRA
jgi:hypothetical protein